MTEEERKKLSELSVDDLVEMVGALRESSEKAEQKFADERKKVISEFLNGREREEAETEQGDIPLEKNKYFQRLKKRIY